MTRRPLLAGLALACAAPGCRPSASADSPPLVVAVQNLYVGADLRQLLSAWSPEEIPAVVAREYANIRATDFRSRAATIADGLSARGPHLVGLQEVSLFRRQTPGDAGVGNAVPASDVEEDFLQILLVELSRRGARYREVVRYSGLDVELPILNAAGTYDDIRLSDHGVVLARADVEARDPRSRNFGTALTVHLGGGNAGRLELTGGWASIEARWGGTSFRFVSTHLESGDLAPDVQIAQAHELLDSLAAEPLPIVLVGDFSSTPDGLMTRTYADVRAAGFEDAWGVTAGDRDGATCCRDPGLRDPKAPLTRRLDFIFFRGPEGSGLGAPSGVELLGVLESERTTTGLWPSDHAGIVAAFGARDALP